MTRNLPFISPIRLARQGKDDSKDARRTPIPARSHSSSEELTGPADQRLRMVEPTVLQPVPPSRVERRLPAHSPSEAGPGRTPSAYLHRRGDRKWFRGGPFTVLGRASLCSLALIAAGSCERAAGSGGAKRPRSGAAGALDAAARERIMAGGGKGANRGGRRIRRLAYGLSCRGTGWPAPWRDGGGEGQPGLPRPAGACRARRHDDRLGVLPPAGDAAAQSIQAVRLALRGRTGSG